MLFLSATIPNAENSLPDGWNWSKATQSSSSIMRSVQSPSIPILRRGQGVSPPWQRSKKQIELDRIPDYNHQMSRSIGTRTDGSRRLLILVSSKTLRLMVFFLHLFTFKGRAQLKKRKQCAEKHDFLNPQERHHVVSFCPRRLRERRSSRSSILIRPNS